MARLAIWARERPDTEAVARGGRRLGWSVSWHRPVSLSLAPADLAVVLSRKGLAGEVAAAYESRGVPVVVFDLPPVRLERMRTWRALWPGSVNALPEPDHDRAMRLGLVPGGDAPDSDEILLCGQTPDDAAHGLGVDELADWHEQAVVALRRSVPGCRITWRPHPGWLRKLDGVDATEDPESVPFERTVGRPLAAVCSYNSTCGVVAMMYGHRAICSVLSWYRYAAQGDPAAGLVGERDRGAVADLLARCAAVQWSLDEIGSGEPLVRAFSALGVAA